MFILIKNNMNFTNTKIVFTVILIFSFQAIFAQFAPPVGEDGSTAISKDSSAIISWASEVIAFERGLADIAIPEGDYASFGDSTNALGVAEGTSTEIVSLGDAGSITLGFPYAIRNGEGNDFAVFENSFSNNFLEFAFVEVSTDGVRFVRFPSISNIPTDSQTGAFGLSDASLVYNLAGKYEQGYGTPFDLADLADSAGIDINAIGFVRIIDVVGSINPLYGSVDSEGNIINDPYATNFESGGFDLDAVGVIHNNDPELGLQNETVNTILVYPNPTSGQLFIQMAGVACKNITILDPLGRILHQGNQTTINLKEIGLSSGRYLLLMEDENGNFSTSTILLTD